MTLAEWCAAQDGRCPGCGFHEKTQGCRCEGAEWPTFLDALKKAAQNGIVSQSNVRPLIRGRIHPNHIGLYYRRARSIGLLVELDHERSDDTLGRNAGRMEPRYAYKEAS